MGGGGAQRQVPGLVRLPAGAAIDHDPVIAGRQFERAAAGMRLQRKGAGRGLAAIDQAQAALVMDLKQRGLLKDTLVVWGGEFGRTPMGENRDTTGRNHHIDAYTMWFAGGGVKAGYQLGETDELGFNPISDRAHIHDIHATILHLLGLDHKKLTFRFQGRDFRLTDVQGNVITKLFA